MTNSTNILEPHPSSAAQWTAESITAKLLDRLEAAFGRHFQLADKAPANTPYLAIVLRTHFRVESHVANEFAHYCVTVQDLVHQLTGVLIPDLFSPQISESAKSASSADNSPSPI